MTDLRHYILPESNVQIAFSGGRTSAYMLHQVLEANGGLPDRARVVFANTGREMPQTLDFVHDVGARWNVPITWVEYRAEGFALVDRATASEDGSPFRALIEKRRFLPNPVARFCTQELKLRPSKKFLVSLGWSHWLSALGIRADEPSRVNRETQKDRWQRWYPLADAGVTKRDVAAFWQAQPFGLELPTINGTTPLGNCDGCFLKSEANLAALARDYPDRHAWWADMEALVGQWTDGRGAQFRKEYSRKAMGRMVAAQGDWIFDADGALCQANAGECTG